MATSAAIDWRAYSKSAAADERIGRGCGATVAHAAPQVELPDRVEHAALEAASRRPTSCRRRAPAGRPTDRAWRRRAWRRAAPARRAPRRRAGRRCARSPRPPRAPADRRGTPRASCRARPAGARRRRPLRRHLQRRQRLLLDCRRVRRRLQRAARGSDAQPPAASDGRNAWSRSDAVERDAMRLHQCRLMRA